MRFALLRLEDVGPGGYYETEESRRKLLIIADFLHRMQVSFHVGVIPRYIDPTRRIDRSMASSSDPVAAEYRATLRALVRLGASLGMHGYTHQYGNAVSAEGYEFAYADCQTDCAPDDSPQSLTSRNELVRSYAYSRFHAGLTAFIASGLRADWFETPHYTVSPVQRRILEACTLIMYETNPDALDSRRITFRHSLSPLGKTYYVPTPLSYVGGGTVDHDVQRILAESAAYGDQELASFFFHPFLEFPYIKFNHHAQPRYDEASPLHRIVRHLLAERRRFVSVRSLVHV